MRYHQEYPEARISAQCPLFACRVCRTKTGWGHQRWCALSDVIRPTCAECRYWEQCLETCGHPLHRKVGDHT